MKLNHISVIPLRFCFLGISRSAQSTISGWFPPPPTSLLISPALLLCRGTSPDWRSHNRKDGCSSSEKDGLQVNYHLVLQDRLAFSCLCEHWLTISGFLILSFLLTFLPSPLYLFYFILFFRKSLSPVGLTSGCLGIGKLVLRHGPPQLGGASTRACPETPGTEMALNESWRSQKSDTELKSLAQSLVKGNATYFQP